MSPVCDQCSTLIEVNNRRFVGFCSPDCRERARAARDRATAGQAQRQADRRQQAAAHQPAKHFAT